MTLPTVRHHLSLLGPLDLDLTLTCGQAFRWRPIPGGWSGVIGGSEVHVAAESETLLVAGLHGQHLGAEALRHYFRLEEDPRIHLEQAPDLLTIPGFEPLLGLRVLRQEPWETLASFICSAAANLRKITTCVEAVAERWGDPIEGSGRRSFPNAEKIARVRESELRALGLGFRAPYLLATARRVGSAGDRWSWERLRAAPIDEARARLVEMAGVGPKIADCVLLFGLDRLEAYPVDRWIRRATLELSSMPRARDEDLARWATRLGPGRGYLQQILFHLRRTSGPLPALGKGEPANSESPRPRSRSRSLPQPARSPRSSRPRQPGQKVPDLFIFAKVPLPGRVKTRLVPPLTREEAAYAARVCLEVTLARLATCARARTRLLLEGAPDRALRTLCASLGVEIGRQAAGDLGTKLRTAFGQNDGKVVIAIGSDSPTLDPARVEEAVDALERHDVVLGPTEDGGYYLIGTRRPEASTGLFRKIPWSTGNVARATLERAAATGLSVALLPPWYDIDDPASLRRAIDDSSTALPEFARRLTALREKLGP
jgi:N-glycosylase/DNA lyase